MSHNSGIARAAEIFARIEEKAERREKLTVEEAFNELYNEISQLVR